MDSNPTQVDQQMVGKFSENTQKILDLGKQTASKMGHDMVGTQHVLWALFSIEDKSKPYIRNWLEFNMGVT